MPSTVIVVLSDGETYSGSKGCQIVQVDEDILQDDEIEYALEELRDEGVVPRGLTVLARFA